MLAATNSLTPKVTSYAVLILQAGSFVGRLIAGPIADRIGVWKVFGAASMFSALFVLAFWTGRVGPGGAIAGMVLYGMSSGAWLTMVTAATSSISPVSQIGMRIGTLWTVSSISSLVGPVICGALISAGGGKFTYAGVFTGVLMAIGACIIVAPAVVRWYRERKSGKGGSVSDEPS